MLSIIVCTIRPNLVNKLEESISRTIGDVDCEILKFDNKKNKYPISKVYNICKQKAKYKYCLFVHEDVVFKTKNWGNILIDIFNRDKKIGLIGVAGSNYKSKNPSAFWHVRDENLFINIIQHYGKDTHTHLKKGFTNNNLEDVVVIDGVFIALNKSSNVSFNENLKDFHCYDLAVSIDTINNNYKVVVTNQILIEHFSIGTTNINFINQVLNFHKLYKNKLPVGAINSSKKLEKYSLERFLEICMQNRYINNKLLYKYFFYKPFSKFFFRLLWLKLNLIKSKTNPLEHF
tara:strand:+ start:9463 stop:10329 length:867 start_codon:yes stop_codon:yes gene_type:complete